MGNNHPVVYLGVNIVGRCKRSCSAMVGDNMLACWKCNTIVAVLEDGWICSTCGQHGPPFEEPVTTCFKEASVLNTPYETDPPPSHPALGGPRCIS